jgi:predicted DNA-binding protein (MmcQ/YjbR family)
MNFEDFRNYCLGKKGVTEDYPFDGSTAWMKVMGKLFAIANITEMKRAGKMIPPFEFINLKCDPEKAIELRELHQEVQPGWHQNKKHWNSIYTSGSLSDDFLYQQIDHSYELVKNSLTKNQKEELMKLA